MNKLHVIRCSDHAYRKVCAMAASTGMSLSDCLDRLLEESAVEIGASVSAEEALPQVKEVRTCSDPLCGIIGVCDNCEARYRSGASTAGEPDQAS